MREFTIGALVRPGLSAAIFAAVALTALPTGAVADDDSYFDRVRNSGRCWSNCDVPVQNNSRADTYSYQGPQLPSLDQINAVFQDVLRPFAPYTRLSAAYAALPAPTTVQELDTRINNFYVGAYRENDYLLQALDFVRGKIADTNRWTAEHQSYIDANRHLPAILRPKAEALNAMFSKRNLERYRWKDRVTRLRSAEIHFGEAAARARSDAFALLDAVAPPGRLVAKGELLLAAAPLRVSFPREPTPAQGPVFTAASAADRPPWRPIDRPLAINTAATRDQKIDSLRALAPAVARTANTVDAAVVDLRARRAHWSAVSSQRERLENEVRSLRSQVEQLPGQIAEAERETREAKGQYLAERDRLSLRAVQTWIWTTCRDDMVIPVVKEFLISNGLTRVAAKLDAGHVNEFIAEARSITWSSVAPIHGIDAFMAVQQKVLDLLDPLKSRILQSAQFNGLMSTADAAQYAHEVQAQLGQDGADLIEAGGQVEVSAPYRDLVTKLLGPMPPRRTVDQL